MSEQNKPWLPARDRSRHSCKRDNSRTTDANSLIGETDPPQSEVQRFVLQFPISWVAEPRIFGLHPGQCFDCWLPSQRLCKGRSRCVEITLQTVRSGQIKVGYPEVIISGTCRLQQFDCLIKVTQQQMTRANAQLLIAAME